MRWSLVHTSAVRHRGTMRWSCFLGVSQHGWRYHEPSGCPFVRRWTEGICVRMPPNGCPTHAKRSQNQNFSYNRHDRRDSPLSWADGTLKPVTLAQHLSPNMAVLYGHTTNSRTASPLSVHVLCAILSTGMSLLTPLPNAGALSACNGWEILRQEASHEARHHQ